ncbi:Small auxin-up RNA [Sesbania bispinosa]|nr:Small auxin-up RNA [Sesbania bispinosa]
MEVIRRKTLKHLITKVLKGLQFLAMSRAAYSRSRGNYYLLRDVIDKENVPEDVREGHFAVIAMHGGETKRFIVELDYLTDPAFLRLLEEAKEEYGFQQKGALAVPCSPQQLEYIIQNRRSNGMDRASHTS